MDDGGPQYWNGFAEGTASRLPSHSASQIANDFEASLSFKSVCILISPFSVAPIPVYDMASLPQSCFSYVCCWLRPSWAHRCRRRPVSLCSVIGARPHRRIRHQRAVSWERLPTPRWILERGVVPVHGPLGTPPAGTCPRRRIRRQRAPRTLE